MRDASTFIPPTRDIESLREAAVSCQGCDLYKNATQTIFGEGALGRLILVGEQPGDQEDIQGRPFVGPAGRVLNHALESAGISPDTIYATNAVKHFKWSPRGKGRIHETPRASEIRACLPWLEAEIDAVQPRLLVCLGAVATRSLLGLTVKVLANRGRVLNTAPAPVWLRFTLPRY